MVLSASCLPCSGSVRRTRLLAPRRAAGLAGKRCDRRSLRSRFTSPEPPVPASAGLWGNLLGSSGSSSVHSRNDGYGKPVAVRVGPHVGVEFRTVAGREERPMLLAVSSPGCHRGDRVSRSRASAVGCRLAARSRRGARSSRQSTASPFCGLRLQVRQTPRPRCRLALSWKNATTQCVAEKVAMPDHARSNTAIDST
jgi:hypothetical protein